MLRVGKDGIRAGRVCVPAGLPLEHLESASRACHGTQRFLSNTDMPCPPAGLFDVVEGRAAQLAAAAAQQAEAQLALAGELGALADSSAGIRSAVDVVISYQQRSTSGRQGLGREQAEGRQGRVDLCVAD